MTALETRRLRGLPALGWLAAATALATGYLAHAHGLLNHDVAWLLLAAGRMLDGGSYARDFFEVNMPQAIAAYIPPQLLGGALGAPQQLALSLWTLALALQGVALGTLCLRAGAEPVLGGRGIPWFVAWTLAGLLLLPGYDWGQKEHLVVLLGLPLLCAVANPQGRAALGRGLRAYIALLAALGFYLKPHYAALPFLLLATAALRARSWQALRSIESAVLVVAGFAGVLGLLALYPGWLECARWAADLYGAYRAQNWAGMFGIPGMWADALALAAELAVCVLLPRARTLLLPFLLGAVYAWGAYLLQFKGWSYQLLPARLLGFAGLAPALLPVLPRLRDARWPQALAAALAAAAAAMALLCWRALCGSPDPASLGAVPQILAAAEPGSTVYAFSVEVEPMFPAVPLAGMRWSSRYSHLWPLLALARAEQDGDTAQRARLESRYRQALTQSVAEDFRARPPRLVIVDRRPVIGLPRDFDMLGFFLADPAFAQIWRGYTPAAKVYSASGRLDYEVFWRNESADRPAAPPPEA